MLEASVETAAPPVASRSDLLLCRDKLEVDALGADLQELVVRPPGCRADFLNFASDFAPDQLSDSGNSRVSRMEHQTPSVFPGNFRKRKVLGTLCFPFCLPEKLVQANLQDPARAGGDPVLLPPLVWRARFIYLFMCSLGFCGSLASVAEVASFRLCTPRCHLGSSGSYLGSYRLISGRHYYDYSFLCFLATEGWEDGTRRHHTGDKKKKERERF